MKFAIGIPTLNRADLLNYALLEYFKDFPDVSIFIIDNGAQILEKRDHNFKIIRPGENIGVAKSWNMLCDEIYQISDYALILNDDIYFGHKQMIVSEFINRMMIKNVGLAFSEQNFCSFILSKGAFGKVGRFDENFFPAYYEDNDYVYRCQLAGINLLKDPELNSYIFRNSQTIARDPSVNNRFDINKKYYIDKWGGEPQQERYSKPFNSDQ